MLAIYSVPGNPLWNCSTGHQPPSDQFYTNWLRGATHARKRDEHIGLEPQAQGGQIQASRQLLAIQT